MMRASDPTGSSISAAGVRAFADDDTLPLSVQGSAGPAADAPIQTGRSNDGVSAADRMFERVVPDAANSHPVPTTTVATAPRVLAATARPPVKAFRVVRRRWGLRGFGIRTRTDGLVAYLIERATQHGLILSTLT